jgi:glutathione S-transferase
MLTIWGRINAINVQKVVWAADEAGVPYRRIDAGRGHSSVEVGLNPNCRVPVMDDDGFVLWESNVIVRYLCARYAAERLYPTDLLRRMDAERWMDWAGIELMRAYRPAFTAIYDVAPAAPGDVQWHFEKTTGLLEILDAHLASRSYMLGDQFSMADIPAGIIVHAWLNMGLQRGRAIPGIEAVKRWYERLRQRPAAAAAFAAPLA